jgi:hypothetical protein
MQRWIICKSEAKKLETLTLCHAGFVDMGRTPIFILA